MLDRNHYTSQKKQVFPGGNPYRRHRRVQDEEAVPVEVRRRWVGQVLDQVLHDAEEGLTLREFEVIKRNTECIFASKSLLWGATDYQPSLSLGA